MKSSKIAIALLLTGLLAGGLAALLWTNARTSNSEVLSRAPTSLPLKTLEGKLRAVATGETVYVPVYSHIFMSGGSEQLLETTLSVRNTDRTNPIVVESIRYYDTEGIQLREYLSAPIILGPLASTDFLVEERDRSGGVGANFLIDWVAEEPVSEPVIEAVMVGGSDDNRAFAFVRPGYPLARFSREAPE